MPELVEMPRQSGLSTPVTASEKIQQIVGDNTSTAPATSAVSRDLHPSLGSTLLSSRLQLTLPATCAGNF